MNEDLAQNLRLLCSYYKSIADVCRRLDINRPQFNRYLSGRHRPSTHTMRRFCEFFGVEVNELLMPHEQFAALMRRRPAADTSEEPEIPQINDHLRSLANRSNPRLTHYLGYYFEYYFSMSAPEKVLCNLVSLQQTGDQIVFQRSERMQLQPGMPVFHNRYQGMAYLLEDRLFLIDYETLNQCELTQTILFPSFRNRLQYLTGLKIGVSDNSQRMPCSARVIYEYLGQDIPVASALKKCDLYPPDSAHLNPIILKAIQNDIADSESHFCARYL